MKTILTPKSQYEIATHASNCGGEREKNIHIELATHHNLGDRAQKHIAEYTSNKEVHQALVDHQPNLHPYALWCAAEASNQTHLGKNSFTPKERDTIQTKVLNHPNVDSDALHSLAWNPRLHDKILAHPLTGSLTKARIAAKGSDEIRQKLMDNGDHDDPYVRHSMITSGNEHLQNQILDKYSSHKQTIAKIATQHAVSTQVKQRAEGMLKNL